MINKAPQQSPKLVVITGPTASGKTSIAAHLAYRINGEIISADSRQVYRGMDLGTGKDYEDYIVEGQSIPYHLIDITEPGTPYNVYAYQQDFIQSFNDLTSRNKVPVLCGGSGFYLEAVLKGYRLIEVPPDDSYRAWAKSQTNETLIAELKDLQQLHNTTDTENRKRLIRALEIARYYHHNPQVDQSYPDFTPEIIGIKYERSTERKRITERLNQRLEAGMIEEAKRLTDQYGWEKMEYFGLEYKYLSLHLRGELSYDEMFSRLNTAIHQFAKRQMTWFRRMERQGMIIHWIRGERSLSEKIEKSVAIFHQATAE